MARSIYFVVVRAVRGCCGDLTPVIVKDQIPLAEAQSIANRTPNAWVEEWTDEGYGRRQSQRVVYGTEVLEAVT